jgi:hypothetical protein
MGQLPRRSNRPAPTTDNSAATGNQQARLAAGCRAPFSKRDVLANPQLAAQRLSPTEQRGKSRWPLNESVTDGLLRFFLCSSCIAFDCSLHGWAAHRKSKRMEVMGHPELFSPDDHLL